MTRTKKPTQFFHLTHRSHMLEYNTGFHEDSRQAYLLDAVKTDEDKNSKDFYEKKIAR